MNIGMNVSRLGGQRLGVGRYIEYMLQYWSKMLGPDERVNAYLRAELSIESTAHLKLGENIRMEVVRPNFPGMLWENLAMAFHARHDDVFFGPAYSVPLLLRTPRKRVVATHSVYEEADWKYNFTYGARDKYCARTASAVIVPCASTADQVAKHYGIPHQRLFSIPQGAPPAFRPVKDAAAQRRTRIELLGGDVPFVVFVGRLSARRNIPNLVAGFAKAKKLKGLPHKLLLFGPKNVDLPLAEICREHGVTQDVVQTTGCISKHEDLVQIYNAAEIFIQPSYYEGWSITTVEAMACGTAVVAADSGALGEIARGHAYMLKDPTADAIADALIKVLLDERLKDDLRQLARQRGSTMTWERTTGETLEIIRHVARS